MNVLLTLLNQEKQAGFSVYLIYWTDNKGLMWPLQNKLQTSWLTHDTMRMMVCGCWKKVMGSKAPPAFPAPYACIPSMVQTPVCSAPLARRCFKGSGCAEPQDAEYPRSCCRCCCCRSTDGWVDGWMEMDGWSYHHAESSTQSHTVFFS